MAKTGEKARKALRSTTIPKPEFSRLADVSRIGRLEHRMEITADAAERVALARRFGLAELAELGATLVLKKRGDGIVEVTGRYRALLAQPCVVTLDPVWATITDEVRLFFGGTLGKPPADLDPLDEDGWPEPIEGGAIDVGEAVAQLMAIALDPYPRAPGTEAANAG
ncbi:MAG: YceD family protein [Alphaproteobacteria bacterium]